MAIPEVRELDAHAAVFAESGLSKQRHYINILAYPFYFCKRQAQRQAEDRNNTT